MAATAREPPRSIEPFDTGTAMVFLRGSGLPFADALLRRLLDGAPRIEERRGLFRPVVLNLLPDLPNLNTLWMRYNKALTSLGGLPDMPSLETFALHSWSDVAASATEAAMTSVERLELELPNVDEVLAIAAALPGLKELVLVRDQVTDVQVGEFMAERRKAALTKPTVSFSSRAVLRRY